MGCGSSSEFETECSREFEASFQKVQSIFRSSEGLERHKKDVFAFLWNSHLLSLLHAYHAQNKDLKGLMEEKLSTEESIKRQGFIFEKMSMAFRHLVDEMKKASKKRDEAAIRLTKIQGSMPVEVNKVKPSLATADNSYEPSLSAVKKKGQQSKIRSSYETQMSRIPDSFEPSYQLNTEKSQADPRRSIIKEQSNVISILSTLESQMSDLKTELTLTAHQLQKQRSINKSLTHQNNKLQKMIQDLQVSELTERDSQTLSRSASVYRHQCHYLEEERNKMEVNNIQLETQNRQLQEAINRTPNLETDKLMSLFSHSRLLPGYEMVDEAVRIRKELQSVFGTIRQTKLLYYYDKINVLHFGEYLKNGENLCLLVTLQNGTLVGGYQGTPTSRNQYYNSFIFSLNSQREPLKLTTQTLIPRIDHDPSMLNFGLGQVKIKAKSLQFSCNVGGFNSIYTNNGKIAFLSTFLEGGRYEQEAVSYEVHSVEVEDES